jgi:hypothetical protein
MPSRMTVNFSVGAIPFSTSSSRTSGLTAMRTSEVRARLRSTWRKNAVLPAPK